jgi:hypothetical protein
MTVNLQVITRNKPCSTVVQLYDSLDSLKMLFAVFAVSVSIALDAGVNSIFTDPAAVKLRQRGHSPSRSDWMRRSHGARLQAPAVQASSNISSNMQPPRPHSTLCAGGGRGRRLEALEGGAEVEARAGDSG